jgi:hypothetical protein
MLESRDDADIFLCLLHLDCEIALDLLYMFSSMVRV